MLCLGFLFIDVMNLSLIIIDPNKLSACRRRIKNIIGTIMYVSGSNSRLRLRFLG